MGDIKQGRTFTIFLLGTGCSRFDKPEGSYEQGELLTRFANEFIQNPDLDEYIDYLVVDGVGSNNQDNHLVWTDPTTYWNKSQSTFGYGLDEKLQNIMAVIKGKPTRKDPVIQQRAKNVAAQIEARKLGPIKKIIAVGWSRGAAMLIKLGNVLHEYDKTIENYYVLVDPVVGSVASTNYLTYPKEDQLCVKNNIKKMRIIFARDELSCYFEGVFPQKDKENKDTELEIKIIPGHHGTLVGNAGSKVAKTFVEKKPPSSLEKALKEPVDAKIKYQPTNTNTDIIAKNAASDKFWKDHVLEYKRRKSESGETTITNYAPTMVLTEFLVREFMYLHGSPIKFEKKLTPLEIYHLYQRMQANHADFNNFLKETYTTALVNERYFYYGREWKAQTNVPEFQLQTPINWREMEVVSKEDKIKVKLKLPHPENIPVNSHHESLVNKINQKMDKHSENKQLNNYFKFIKEKQNPFKERLANAYFLIKFTEKYVDKNHLNYVVVKSILKQVTEQCFGFDLPDWFKSTLIPAVCNYYKANQAYLCRFTASQQPVEYYASEHQEEAKKSTANLNDLEDNLHRFEVYLTEAEKMIGVETVNEIRSQIIMPCFLRKLHHHLQNFALLCDKFEKASTAKEHEELIFSEEKFNPFLSIMNARRSELGPEMVENLQHCYDLQLQRFTWLQECVTEKTETESKIVSKTPVEKQLYIDQKMRELIESTLREDPGQCLLWLVRLEKYHHAADPAKTIFPDYAPLANSILTTLNMPTTENIEHDNIGKHMIHLVQGHIHELKKMIVEVGQNGFFLPTTQRSQPSSLPLEKPENGSPSSPPSTRGPTYKK